MPRPLTLRHLLANFVGLFKVDSSKKSSYLLEIRGKGLQFYIKTIQINFGLRPKVLDRMLVVTLKFYAN